MSENFENFWKQPISKEIFNKKYNLYNQTEKEFFESIAEEVSSVEKDKLLRKKWKDNFFEELSSTRFIPAGRILANARTFSKLKNYNNCFTIEVNDDMQEIYKALAEDAQISKMGGGVGFNISKLRPEGDRLSRGGEASGPLSFLRVFNESAKIIMTGGQRRSAHIAVMNVDHPDIEKFITVKQGDKNKELTQFNISVGLTDDFMKAVESNEDWELKFDDKVYKTLKARDLYDKIAYNAYEHNEPGIFNLDIVNKYNNGWYMYYIQEVNPCFTGDTIVATADGRNGVSIKQLAEEGKDVPVYAKNGKETVIKTMRNPRVTGYNKDIYKITLDDGSEIKCTGNHKFLMKDGNYKRADELLNNDSLNVSVKYKTTIEEVFKESNSKSSEYWMINNGKKNIFEHRFIFEQLNNTKIPKNHVIHHKDFNGVNNSVNNLELMSKREHDIFHGERIRGKNNPMNRFPEKNWMNDPDKQQKMRERKHIGAKRSEETKRKIGEKTLERFNNLEFKQRHSNSVKESMKNNVNYINAIEKIKDKNLSERQNQTDLKCFRDNNGVIVVEKNCEGCGKKFTVPFNRREIAYCNHSCYLNNSDHMKKMKLKNHDHAIKRKRKIQEKIIDLFSEYVNKNTKIPNKNEFFNLLKENDINDLRTGGFKNSYSNFINKILYNYNVNPISSRFLTYNIKDCQYSKAQELIDHGLVYNHKVVSVEYIGKDTVYNGTVDDVHNFDTIFNETKTKSGRTKLLSCNSLQCGEQPIPPYNVCDLGAINLTKFVERAFSVDAKFNYEKFSETIFRAVRFLDNVLDATDYPLERIREQAQSNRRIGLGFTGLADTFAMLSVKYGSKESKSLSEKIAKSLRDYSYKASVALAIEKGPFPNYDKKYLESKFVKKLNSDTIKEIEKYGIRNVSLNTVAPTGTTSFSIGQNCSSGIEPIFSLQYDRKIRTGKEDETTTETVYDYAWLKYQEETGEKEPNEYFVTTMDVDPYDAIDIQAIFQIYTDASISKTANLPPGYTFDQYKDLFSYAYKNGLKGFTSFNPEGCASPETKVLTTDGIKEFEEIFEKENIDIYDENNKGWHYLRNNLEFYDENGDPRKINKAFIKGLTSNMLNITLEGGETLCVSPEHKFRINGKWVKAEDLQEGDNLDVHIGERN